MSRKKTVVPISNEMKSAIEFQDDFAAIMNECQSQSDRGVALIVAADLDDNLERAIKSRLVDASAAKDVSLFAKLFSGYGPLSSFSGRIDLARGLQLIGEKTYQDLAIIRRIRNDFAHKIRWESDPKPLTFETKSIASRCNNLWLPKNLGVVYYGDRAKQVASYLSTAKGQYIYAARTISWNVTLQAQGMMALDNNPDYKMATLK